MNTAASSDEKVLAALAHGSVFMMFLGPVVPVILWASQRKKSKYVSFHALQAMGYQALYFWLGIVVAILIMMLFICLIPVLSISLQNSGEPTLIPFLVQVPIMLSLFGYLGLFFILGIVGAVSCFLGRDFRYPVLGRWLERYLSYDADSETQIMEAHEDNWDAAICHATAILQLWGVVTPLIVWFSQKERSTRLRFQAMQAFFVSAPGICRLFSGNGRVHGSFSWDVPHNDFGWKPGRQQRCPWSACFHDDVPGCHACLLADYLHRHAHLLSTCLGSRIPRHPRS